MMLRRILMMMVLVSIMIMMAMMLIFTMILNMADDDNINTDSNNIQSCKPGSWKVPHSSTPYLHPP